MHGRSLVLAPMLAAGVASLVLAGCERAPVAPAPLAVGALHANAVSNTIDRDFSVGPFDGCDGDVISGTGTEHTVVAERSDGAGGLHINVKQQFHNVRLTGSPSGASYAGSGTSTTNAYVAPAEVLSGVVMQHFTIDLVGQGRTPNLRLQGTLRIVISANGIERVFADTFTAVCH